NAHEQSQPAGGTVRGVVLDSAAGRPHPPCGWEVGSTRLARCPSLSHGGKRSLCGGLSERRAPDAIPRLGDAARSTPTYPRGFAVSEICAQYEYLLGDPAGAGRSVRLEGAGGGGELAAAGRADPGAGR